MKRVLVLGGGGVIGVAWETGVVVGLNESGFDPRTVDAIVGTSAGAIVGAQLAAGRLPAMPTSDRGGRQPVDPTKIDVQALTQVFRIWGQMEHTTIEQAAGIGKAARGVQRDAEDEFVARMDTAAGVAEWPAMRLLIAAVDTESGERRIFDRRGNTPLPRAIAASASVPGLFPSVTIDGRLYMDGQVHSSTNADVLVELSPVQVLIAMPTNAVTARGIGAHAERMLETEIALLHAVGSSVSLRTPSADDAERLGPNLMDPAQAPEAYAVGLATGRAWATQLGD
jgi:NTE family protein